MIEHDELIARSKANDIRNEREEAFMHGVGLLLIITTAGLIGVAIYVIPWQATAFVAAVFALPVGNLARCIWRQRKTA